MSFTRRIALVALLLPVFALAKEPVLKPVEQVQKDLDYLAGPECEGRGLKTGGILKAGDYVADQFKLAGLKPAFKDGYFQPFDVPGPNKLGTPITVVFRSGETKIEPKVGEDFTATTSTVGGKTKLGMVFVGYGVTSKDAPKYDDYAGVDVKGKLVVVMRRLPNYSDPKGPFGENSPLASFASKIQNAYAHEAAGILFVSDTELADKTDPLLESGKALGGQLPGPVLHIKRALLDSLLKDRKTTIGEIEQGIAKGWKPNSFEMKGWEAESEITLLKVKYPTRNVVGVLEGDGPLADETIVLGAHYDHLGAGEPGSFPGGEGKTHYGADDNASGTTGLLTLARHYGALKERKGRRMVFVAFSGEEQGLFGSKHYCEKPAFPLDKTAFMINMDMIGRMVEVDDKDKAEAVVKKDRIVVYGTGTSTGLEKLVDESNAKFDFKMFKIPGGQGPSDHTSFYNKKIPVLFFFTGTHKDYHRPSDTPDKINAKGLLKVTEFVKVFADHFAGVKEKPDYIKTKGGEEDPTETTKTQGRLSIPTIGFAPDNYGEETKGVLVGSVRKDGPGEKGGLKEGDFIVEVAGKPVTNMTGYMQALGTVKSGTETEFVVMRNEKKVTLKITPILPAPPK